MNTEVRTITINNTQLPVKEYKNQRVVTFADIDTVHGRPEGTAKRNFAANKNHLIEGDDYFVIKVSDIQKYEKHTFGFEVPNRGLTLLTESGYLLLVKSFTDDLAWDVQRKLVSIYFRSKETQSLANMMNSPLTREELAAYMLYNERHTDVIEKMMSSFIDNQTKSTEQFMSNQTKVIDDFCKSMLSSFKGYMGIISDTLDIVKRLAESTTNSTTHSSAAIDIEEERWKANAFNMVNKICKDYEYGNGNLVLAKVYKLIHEKDGVDLAKKKNEYMLTNNTPVSSTISYIAKFPELRKLFDKRVKEFDGSHCTDKTKQPPFSIQVRTTPKEVYEVAQPVFEKIDGKNYALRLLYKEMEKLSGLSLNDLAKEFATKHNVSAVTKGYIIGQDKQLMELLTKAVDSLLVGMEETK